MDDADALLAQALWAAEQADYAQMGFGSGEGSDGSDEEWGSAKRRRKTAAKQQPRRPRASKGGSRSTSSSSRAAATAAPSAAAAAAAAVAAAPAAASGDGQRDDSEPGVAPQAAADATNGSGEQQQQDGDDAHCLSGRRKRKDMGTKREAGRAWSEQEKAAFVAGLEQHGRDWRAVAHVVGTRDARAVASHAQKHFIRLALAGAPLPAKVAESGRGYTLSGRLLDPASAAAAQYGFSAAAIQRLEGEALATALSGMLPLDTAAAGDSGAARDQQAVQDSGGGGGAGGGSSGRPPKRLRQRASSSTPAGLQQGDVQGKKAAAAAPAPAASDAKELAADELALLLAAAPRPVLAASERARQESVAAAACASGAAPGDAEQHLGAAAEPAAVAAGAGDAAVAARADSSPAGRGVGLTEYAAARPRREAASRRVQLGDTSEELALVPCSEYVGPPGSGLPGSQPFVVELDLAAACLMEVHAHASGCEVIGLLGGSFDAAGRRLVIATAYPCARVAGSDDATSVELDPTAEVEARGAMAAAGQRCVGWYHSHPVFAPQPSLKDMDNQRNYQALTRHTEGGDGDAAAPHAASSGGGAAAAGAGGALEPFVGFILGPYDPALPLPHTCTTAFVVQQGARSLVPYRLAVGMINARQAPGSAANAAALHSLLAATRDDPARTNFAAMWRPFTALAPGGRLLGPPLTKLDKLLAALRWQCSHVRDAPAVDAWLAAVVAGLQECWGVALPSPAGGPQQQEQAQRQEQAQAGPDNHPAVPEEEPAAAAADAGASGDQPADGQGGADDAAVAAAADPPRAPGGEAPGAAVAAAAGEPSPCAVAGQPDAGEEAAAAAGVEEEAAAAAGSGITPLPAAEG